MMKVLDESSATGFCSKYRVEQDKGKEDWNFNKDLSVLLGA